MSVKKIPSAGSGLLPSKGYFYATVTELKERENWEHADGVTAAYEGSIEIEGLVPDTCEETFDPWMKRKIRLGFYIPGEEAKWYNGALTSFNNFAKACEQDPEAFDPDQCMGKTIIVKFRRPKSETPKLEVDKRTGLKVMSEPRDELDKYYHPSQFEG